MSAHLQQMPHHLRCQRPRPNPKGESLWSPGHPPPLCSREGMWSFFFRAVSMHISPIGDNPRGLFPFKPRNFTSWATTSEFSAQIWYAWVESRWCEPFLHKCQQLNNTPLLPDIWSNVKLEEDTSVGPQRSLFYFCPTTPNLVADPNMVLVDMHKDGVTSKVLPLLLASRLEIGVLVASKQAASKQHASSQQEASSK